MKTITWIFLLLLGAVGLFGCSTNAPRSESTAATTQALGEAGAPSTERTPPPSSCSRDACVAAGRECGPLETEYDERLNCGKCSSEETCEDGKCIPIPCVPDGMYALSCSGNTVIQTDNCGTVTTVSDCPYGCADAACIEPRCGDSVVQAGEACDDGNASDGDRCGADCSHAFRYAFVTSEMHTGDLGGLEGADTICQRLAEAAKLPGTYLAWLSDWWPQPIGYRSPQRRFVASPAGYITVTGVKIADDTADLFDFALDAPLNVTELGEPAPVNTAIRCAGSPVRTGAFGNGTHIPFIYNQTCGEWTSTNGAAIFGDASTASKFWSYGCVTSGSCALEAPHYCFEQ